MAEKKEDPILEEIKTLVKTMESYLQKIEKETIRQGQLLEGHERRIFKLEGPRKFYKINKDGHFIP